MASDIITINDDGTVIRPMYAGNGMATVEMDGPVKVISVRATAFDAAPENFIPSPVEKVAAEIDPASLKMQFVVFNEIKSDRPQLTEAKIVISGAAGSSPARTSRPCSSRWSTWSAPRWAPAAPR